MRKGVATNLVDPATVVVFRIESRCEHNVEQNTRLFCVSESY